MDARDELKTMLRPAGGGLYVVSTGKAEQEAMQRRLYSASNEDEVRDRFDAAIDGIARARVVVMGVPSDVGAGFLRGANVGPQSIRAALLERHGDWNAWCAARGIVDIGDVFVVPQLLHDDMLSTSQIAASRRAMHHPEGADLPVSPLSVAERALRRVLELGPNAKPFVLGGDHSCAWPVTSALHAARAALATRESSLRRANCARASHPSLSGHCHQTPRSRTRGPLVVVHTDPGRTSCAGPSASTYCSVPTARAACACSLSSPSPRASPDTSAPSVSPPAFPSPNPPEVLPIGRVASSEEPLSATRLHRSATPSRAWPRLALVRKWGQDHPEMSTTHSCQLVDLRPSVLKPSRSVHARPRETV